MSTATAQEMKILRNPQFMRYIVWKLSGGNPELPPGHRYFTLHVLWSCCLDANSTSTIVPIPALMNEVDDFAASWGRLPYGWRSLRGKVQPEDGSTQTDAQVRKRSRTIDRICEDTSTAISNNICLLCKVTRLPASLKVEFFPHLFTGEMLLQVQDRWGEANRDFLAKLNPRIFPIDSQRTVSGKKRISTRTSIKTRPDEVFWTTLAAKAYWAKDNDRARLYSEDALRVNPRFFPAIVYHSQSLLHCGEIEHFCEFVYNNRNIWHAIIRPQTKDWNSLTAGVNLDIGWVTFLANDAAHQLREYEGPNSDHCDAMMDYFEMLAFPENAHDVWNALVSLYDKRQFMDHTDGFLAFAARYAGCAGFDWVEAQAHDALMFHAKPDVKACFPSWLCHFGTVYADLRKRALGMIDQFTADESEEARAAALGPYLVLAEDGPVRVVAALHDIAANVRLEAFKLLTGQYTSIPLRNASPIKIPFHHQQRAALRDEIKAYFSWEPDEFLFGEIRALLRESSTAWLGSVDLSSISPKETYAPEQSCIRGLSQVPKEEARDDILRIAMHSAYDEKRAAAVKELQNRDYVIPSEWLRAAHAREGVLEVKEELERLMVEKGDGTLLDIYLKIFRRNVDCGYFCHRVFGRITESNMPAAIHEAVEYATSRGRSGAIVDGLSEMYALGYVQECASFITWCLNNCQPSADVMLLAGKIRKVPLNLIEAYKDWDDYAIRVCALRALEYRLRNGQGAVDLLNLFDEMLSRTSRYDHKKHHILLLVIDGILEFLGPERALLLYKRVYGKIGYKASTAKREAWERLRILGIVEPHRTFQSAKPKVPWLWPNREGPFYGIEKQQGQGS